MYDQQSRLDYNSLSQEKKGSTGNTVSPISAEISKLLAEFEKHIKYKKVS